MKYEVILFDADETLYDFKKSEREAFKNTMLKFNIKYDENYHLKTYEEINTAIWKEFEQGLITQAKLKIERFKRLSDRLELGLDETNLAKVYMEHLADASFLYDKSTDLIETLNKSFKLAIVTNGLTLVQDKRIRKSSIAKFFETIVISEEILISKPNPKIFEHTLKEINFSDKSKILIVGDSLSSDIQGGINFGIDTCWYNPKKIANKTSIKPTYEVSNFDELKALLLNS
ncbi:MAG: YjjG family noncanonical pyrimidine nucleotidase [Clostridium perfringens]|nr:YjjG family noncanonical pyrimidine nucleotidase [Clostridium perfringens]